MKFAALAATLLAAWESGAERASIRGKNSLEEQALKAGVADETRGETPSPPLEAEAYAPAPDDVREGGRDGGGEDARVQATETGGLWPTHDWHQPSPSHGSFWPDHPPSPSWDWPHSPHQPSGGQFPFPSPNVPPSPSRGSEWDALHRVLGREAVKDVTVQDFISHCTGELEIPYNRRTNWHLQVSDPDVVNPNSGQTSALCMAIMFCAFKDCNPNPNSESRRALFEAIKPGGWMPESRSNGGLQANAQTEWGNGSLPRDVERWISQPGNPSSNLPRAEMLPESALEVVEAVKFAEEKKIKLSIKNSGHSYAGQSTKADTLLLGMKRMPKRSSIIKTCDSRRNYQNLDACKLAVDRKKPGYVQIGGGENFAEVYLNVRKYNEDHGYTFQAFGGASATVSPFGYSMMGGLSGTTGGRKHGFGADQILMVEMVLPNGHYVKFGPTAWRSKRGSQLVPQTTAVDGQCCRDYDRNGHCQTWGSCPEHIPFEKLWKAFRGGGGGWGVVIAIYQQLHEYQQFEQFLFNNPTDRGCIEYFAANEGASMKQLFASQMFFMQYYLNATYFEDSDDTHGFTSQGHFAIRPDYVPYGVVSDEKRSSCSTPSAVSGTMFCDGADYAKAALETYKTFLDNWNLLIDVSTDNSENEVQNAGFKALKFRDDKEKETFKRCAFDGTRSDVRAWVDANEMGLGGGKPNRFDPSVQAAERRRDYVPEEYCVGQFQKKIDNTLGRDEHLCLAGEFDGPDFSGPSDDAAPVLIPVDFLTAQYGQKLSTGEFSSALDYDILLTYLAYGPGTMHGSDGMDSVTTAMRKAGTHSNLKFINTEDDIAAPYDDSFFGEGGAFRLMYGITEEVEKSGILPAFINPMHATPNVRGPQKSNWKLACPLEWDKATRDRECFSLQESIFGTELLCELETFKKQFDGEGMMTPPYGVGDLDDDVLDELLRRCPRREDETLFAPRSQKEVCSGFGIKTCPSVLVCQANNPVGHNFDALAFGTQCGDDPSGQACLASLCVCCEGVNLETTLVKEAVSL